MGNIGEVMTNQTIPPVGSAGTNYARDITLFLTEVKQRLEDPVPLSSVTITDLDMGNNAISNVKSLGLYQQVNSPTTPVGSIQRYGGNLYWVSSGGAVQITNGAALNASGIGGLTGDYGGANPAQLRFVDADATYYAYDDYAGATWAGIFAKQFDVSGDGVGNQRVRISWAGSASYTLELPVALPGSQLMLQMEADGTMVASNTLASALTITTGGINVTAGDITLGANEDIILSGTGKIKHGTRTLSDTASLRCVPGAVGATFFNGPDPRIDITAGNQLNIHTPPVPQGHMINSFSITGAGAGGSTPPTITVDRLNSDRTLTNMPVTTNILGVVTGNWEYVITVTTPFVQSAGAVPVIRYTPAGATASVYSVQVNYTSE